MDLWHLYLVKCGERDKKSDKNPLNFHLDDVKQANKFTSVLLNSLVFFFEFALTLAFFISCERTVWKL